MLLARMSPWDGAKFGRLAIFGSDRVAPVLLLLHNEMQMPLMMMGKRRERRKLAERKGDANEMQGLQQPLHGGHCCCHLLDWWWSNQINSSTSSVDDVTLMWLICLCPLALFCLPSPHSFLPSSNWIDRSGLSLYFFFNYDPLRPLSTLWHPFHPHSHTHRPTASL